MIDLAAADNHYKTAHNLYREYVRRAVASRGLDEVARLLAYHPSHIESILRRDRITHLRMLAQEIEENGI